MSDKKPAATDKATGDEGKLAEAEAPSATSPHSRHFPTLPPPMPYSAHPGYYGRHPMRSDRSPAAPPGSPPAGFWPPVREIIPSMQLSNPGSLQKVTPDTRQLVPPDFASPLASSLREKTPGSRPSSSKRPRGTGTSFTRASCWHARTLSVGCVDHYVELWPCICVLG